MHHTPDIAIEDVINRLADDLAAFCFERLEEDVSLCHRCVQEVMLDQSWYLFDDKLGKEEYDNQCVDNG
jgi:hypothetical protein